MLIEEENKKPEELEGKVQCAICDKWFKYVAIAHLKKHGVTSMDEYKKMYPNAKITGKAYCQMRKELASKQMTRRWKADYNSVYDAIHNRKTTEKRVKTRLQNNLLRKI
jgi:uncharacterized Zn finger protein (UPF0148 family)